jgi:hypothetical protein
MIEAANRGRVAQLGEHLLCKQGVTGSIPVTSTNILMAFSRSRPVDVPQFPDKPYIACHGRF